jgi:flagellar biosynthesis protein FlhA
LKEMEVARGDIRANMLLVMDPQGAPLTLPGEATVEPTFGLNAMWILPPLKDEAVMKGLTVVDPATVVTTHLTEVVRENLADMLSYAETQKLLSELSPEYQKLLSELVPAKITTAGIQRVLQGLLAERVSIRDLGTIMEGIAEASGAVKAPRDIVEHVRTRLARQICAQYAAPGGLLPIVTLSPHWEAAFLDSIVGQGEDRHLAMQPSRLTDFVHAVRDRFEEAARMGEMPVLVTSVPARPFVRSIVERFRRETPVLSQGEIHARVRLKTVGSI